MNTGRMNLEPPLMASDPFVVHGLVDVTVLAVSPALRHADFPARWAATAQAVAAA